MSNLDNVIDLNVCENATLGIGEKNIVKGLMMPDRFILPGMDSSFDLKSFCLAEDRDKETLSHQFILSESYLMKCSIQLSAGCTIVIASDLSRDMRHVFLKGYLMVMSYNLAFTSNIVKYQYNKIASVKVRDRRFFDKEDYIMKNKVVVDSCYFTNEEMWVLVEMCDIYPKKRFGEPNIYNNLVLDKDDLLVFADNENVNFGWPPVYCNPERLWNNIVNIAIKMGVVDDLCEIVAGMRGLPYFLREANALTGKCCFLLDFPFSYSPTLGLERVTTLPSTQGFIGHSGYYGSSKCLVADLQLGQMMLMSLFNIIEQLGAIGIIGVPSGNVRTDPFFHSRLREWGLKSDNENDNSLLQEWRGFRGVPLTLIMSGNLMDVVVALAGEIRDGVYSRLRPQLLHALPFSTCEHTTWGTIRGYKMPESESAVYSKEDKVKQKLLKLKAFAWVMGVTSKVPKVGFNAFWQLLDENLSNEELKLMALVDGSYDLSSVTHKINGRVGRFGI